MTITVAQFNDIKDLRQEQIESVIATTLKVEVYPPGRTKPRLEGGEVQTWVPYYGAAFLGPKKPSLGYNVFTSVYQGLANFGIYFMGFTVKNGKDVAYIYIEAYDNFYPVVNPDWKAPVNTAQSLSNEIQKILQDRPKDDE